MREQAPSYLQKEDSKNAMKTQTNIRPPPERPRVYWVIRFVFLPLYIITVENLVENVDKSWGKGAFFAVICFVYNG